MKNSEIVIHSRGTVTELIVNGKRLDDIEGLTFIHKAGETAKMTLEVDVQCFTVDKE